MRLQMKKTLFSRRVLSVLTTAVLILTLAGMIPAPGVSVGEVCAAEAEEDSKGIDGFGSDEGFAIVPQYAGASALDVSVSDKTNVQLYSATSRFGRLTQVK